MTIYEIITSLIAILAVIISTISLIRANSIHKENLSIQKTIEKLAIKQLDQIEITDKKQFIANIQIKITNKANGRRFVISNNGKGKALDVYISVNENSYTNPFDPDEYKRKIPIEFLSSGSSIEMLAKIYDQDQGTIIIDARWMNVDGSQSKEQFSFSR